MSIPSDFTTSKEKIETYPEEDIAILDECAGVDTSDIDGHRLSVFNGYERIARIEYYVFNSSNEAYIGWLTVIKDYRRQGIAREIRKTTIDYLCQTGVDKIWTGPVADVLKPLVRQQGFKPASNMEKFSDYYVYTNQ